MTLRILTLAVCLAGAAFTQEAPKEPETKFYRLDFVVKELDEGKTVSAKSYTTYANTKSLTCSIRTGSRVPFPTGGAPGQFNYVDVGVNIDCGGQLREHGSQLMLTIVADISSVPAGGEATPNFLPLVRQNKWNAMVILPMGKPTTLFSSDDLNSKRKMQLELTATPIK